MWKNSSSTRGKSVRVLWHLQEDVGPNPDYYAVFAQEQAPQLKAVASKDIKPMNQKFCPVYTDTRVHPKSPFIEHDGKKIYFSKTRAKSRFESNPEKYLENIK